MKIETEVTAVKNKAEKTAAKKTYVINDVCAFTGITSIADAVMVTKQAFISAGRQLVMKKWLEKHPCPSGVQVSNWMKGAKVEEITSDMWPTAEAVLSAARAKAVKEKKSKGMSQEEILAQAAAIMGISLQSLLAKAQEQEEDEDEDEDEES